MLTTAEQDSLAEHEAIIERGLQTFIEVGEALAAIRDRREYRATHSTFADYCRDRWGLSDSRARRLISASETASSVPIGTPVPANEGQARELAGLDSDAVGAVMRAAHEATGGKITAAAIRSARADRDGGTALPGIRLDSGHRYALDGCDDPVTSSAELFGRIISDTEWCTAWAAWQLRHDGHSLDAIAEMGQAECHQPGGYTPASWPHLKEHHYAHWFVQSQDGGRLMVQGLNVPSLVYAYVDAWQKALTDERVSVVPGQVRVPAEQFPAELAELRDSAAYNCAPAVEISEEAPHTD